MAQSQNLFKNMQPIEIGVFVFFLIFLVFDIRPPHFMEKFINTPLGVIVILLFSAFLFCYTNPLLGIVSLLVAYELIRRSSEIIIVASHKTNIAPISSIPLVSIPHINQNLNLNPLQNSGIENRPNTISITLEEEVVNVMSPVGKSEPSVYIDTTFKPISINSHLGASL